MFFVIEWNSTSHICPWNSTSHIAFCPPSAFAFPRFIPQSQYPICVLSPTRIFSSAFYPSSAISHPYFIIRIRITHKLLRKGLKNIKPKNAKLKKCKTKKRKTKTCKTKKCKIKKCKTKKCKTKKCKTKKM